MATLRPDTGTTARPGTGAAAAGHAPTVIAAGRAFAAVGFTETCTITRVAGSATDPATGAVVVNRTTLYTGQCRIQQAAAAWAGPTDVGEAQLRLSSSQLQLPVEGTEGLRIDDRVTVTAARNDSDLVGRVFAITGPNAKTDATTRKFPLLEVLS